MTHQELTVLKNLLQEFKICTQLQYNGQLEINSSKGQRWTFYYRLGRIVWATGGKHPFRRWRRQIAQNCPQIDLDKLRFRPEDISSDFSDYRLLEILYKRQKIQREQIHAVVENTIAELFFDLAYEADFTPVTCERNQKVILDTPMSYTSADISLQHMQGSWKIWSEAGLANFSPDLAPSHPQARTTPTDSQSICLQQLRKFDQRQIYIAGFSSKNEAECTASFSFIASLYPQRNYRTCRST